MSCVVKKAPSQNQACGIQGDNGLKSLLAGEDHENVAIITMQKLSYTHRLTFPAVKVYMGRKMMASLASGILVQTAARTVMMAPD